MSESISFEHAADFYDATRAVPNEVSAKLTTALLAELTRVGADSLLEVGVGTGRRPRRPRVAQGRHMGIVLDSDVSGVALVNRLIGEDVADLGDSLSGKPAELVSVTDAQEPRAGDTLDLGAQLTQDGFRQLRAPAPRVFRHPKRLGR